MFLILHAAHGVHGLRNVWQFERGKGVSTVNKMDAGQGRYRAMATNVFNVDLQLVY